ncbi:protein STRUBBELIG-RECEPTOR FAMILY 3-like isoform X1 [Typha angustifolia]|uniref:protein STRUBBELIG-RECEPTOR FAMILY 3-like isoform X1 n=1 Tax=Typha angustifolia TaxID=59011 RepID=UPI003C2E3B20
MIKLPQTRMGNIGLRISLCLAFSLMAVLLTPFSQAYTNERDVYSINSLYVSLGSPPLPGWIPNGGDPCIEGWQGVQCIDSNITSITINAANLGGQLSNDLGNFTSIVTIDLSNNNIGGSIPENLPTTMRQLFLSANQLTGSIPSSLSKLTVLSAMSVNENHLTGELPNAFQSLTGLINLDLSSNNLSSQLPPSMGSLLSLTTLHIQDNQFSGSLNVLEDLPLKDLNVENNLFSGPVPSKLLSIPNFKKDGNPFNTSTAPSPMSPLPQTTPPPSSSSSGTPSPSRRPTNSSGGSNAQESSPPSKKSSTSTIKIIGVVIVSVISFIVVVLLVIFCMSKYQERNSRDSEFSKSQVGRVHERVEEPKIREHLAKPHNEVKKGKSKISSLSLDLIVSFLFLLFHLKHLEWLLTVAEKVSERQQEHNLALTLADNSVISTDKQKEHVIDVGETGFVAMPPPPVEKVIVNPILYPKNPSRPTSEMTCTSTSATSFSVASLQQYTNSFREENLIRESRLGKVYLAELPDGKLLEVMKIDNVSSRIAVDDFLDLVLNISELRHPNIVELVGYCAEFGQRLLVYNYFSRKTLHDVLHCGDDFNKKLSWNARLQVALGAAKALEYLHEGCQQPIVHQNFEPANVLLNNELEARISECGLAPLMSSNSVTQLSGRLRALFSYEAPEVGESGSSTDRSDVYSFGVVMLELLTGRKPYDSSRPRAEQHLVRWASSQLYDTNALSRMVDPSIQEKCSEKSLSWFADIISRCIQQGPEFRPPMSEVAQDLARLVKDTRNALK